MTLDELEAKVRTLEAWLREATEEWHLALLEAAPHKVGDEVEVRFYSNEDWKRAIVRALWIRYESIHYVVSVQTKAGWGKAEREVHSFSKIRMPEVSE